MEPLNLVLSTIWFFIPAYFANGAPLLLYGFLKNPHRVDGGTKLKDGSPLLGAGKTIEGSLFGILIGIITGLSMFYIQKSLALTYLPTMSLELGFLLGFGAILGDITASFIKRRLGYRRGESFAFADQLDFIIGATLVSSIAYFNHAFLILALFITPIIHKAANIFANRLEFKEVSW